MPALVISNKSRPLNIPVFQSRIPKPEELVVLDKPASRQVETQIKRNAEIEPKPLPITIKSYASQFNINGQRLNVHGDLRIKVGDWDWGDPLDYEPEYVYVVGVKVPVVPLELKTRLYMGLGWMDRVRKIHDAMARRHHKIG